MTDLVVISISAAGGAALPIFFLWLGRLQERRQAEFKRRMFEASQFAQGVREDKRQAERDRLRRQGSA